jgi:type I restriction enzyme M protein
VSQAASIIAKVWNLCNILRDDGITYAGYVTELTFRLFLKMLAETGTRNGCTAATAGKASLP